MNQDRSGQSGEGQFWMLSEEAASNEGNASKRARGCFQFLRYQMVKGLQ